MTKRVLITGAGGFVGQYLISELQKNPENEIFGSLNSQNPQLKKKLSDSHLFYGDLTDPVVTSEQIKAVRPNLVFHLASLSTVHDSNTNALRVMQQNTAISYNLFESLRLYSPTTRTIAICSANEYGAVAPSFIPTSETTPFRPLNPYAVSKITQEMIALQYHLAHGMDIVIARPFNHSGPGQTHDFVLPKIAHQVVAIERGNSPAILEIGSAESMRDFSDVRDMVRAYVQLGELGDSGEAYNLGSGVAHSIREIAHTFLELSQIPFDIVEQQNLNRHEDVPTLIADTSKFNQLAPFIPTISLKSTLSDILEYERKIYGS